MDFMIVEINFKRTREERNWAEVGWRPEVGKNVILLVTLFAYCKKSA